MTRRFVIAIDELSEDNKKELRSFLREHGAWWNWIPNFFLLVTEDDEEISTQIIRERIEKIDGTSYCIVFEFPEDLDWSGRGPIKNKRNMFKWLNETWTK